MPRIYELSKECGASASQLFAKEHDGNTVSERVGNEYYWFEDHYNPSLNACFMLETTEHYYAYQNYNMGSWTLIDVNDNRDIDSESCNWKPLSSSRSDDACFRNNPALLGMTNPAFKDFGNKVARYMERNEQGKTSE